MALASTASHDEVELDRIRVADNVRDLDHSHVDALAGSIALQGMLVPVVLRPHDDDFELVAGFHRIAAAHKLALAKVPYVLRDTETAPADRAVENIARKQLNPHDEARAVKAMLDRGLTEAGAAQALGWPQQRVKARMKLLELPDRAQQLIGQGDLPLASVDVLRRIGDVSQPLQQLVVDHLDHDDTAWLRDRFPAEPAAIVIRAVQDTASAKTFATPLTALGRRDLAVLKLGKRADEQSAELQALVDEIRPHGYMTCRIRFTDSEIDQARAAGVLLELDHGAPLITDRKLYRELAKQALARALGEHRDQAAAARQAKRARRKTAAQAATDPLADAKRTHRTAIRALSDQAHGINLDLGASLISGLSRVDASDMDVARYFVYALLGPDPKDASSYANVGDRVRRIAAYGVRLVVEGFRHDATKTKKDGTRGRLKIDYGDRQVATDPVAATTWLWRFLDGAKTADDLYGRALVVVAAERYAATRLVLPSSQQQHPQHFGSHRDLAEKALAKLAGPHLPASMKQLSKAVDAADAVLRKAETSAPKGATAAATDA